MKVLPAFLSPAEVAELRVIANLGSAEARSSANALRRSIASLGSAEARSSADALRRSIDRAWQAGRQGTGYDKLPLRDVLADHPTVLRARTLLVPHEDLWDVYVIRYLDGAHVPDHVDAAAPGKRHRRINAILTAPRAGGELRIDGVLVELSIGDAVLFEPDREVHHVTPVVGTRLVFSVGAWISEDTSSASSLTTP